MSELLLEILCEEIPARMQVKAGADLARLLGDALGKAGLVVDSVQSFTGPRRLVFVADVPARSPDVKEERKGPRVGSPEQALAGFMRGAGLSDISQAETRSDKKGEHYVAILEKPGRDASEIIAEAVPAVMAKFPWPKSMKWGDGTFRWVRPLTSILCVLDGKVVPFEVADIDSGNITQGHRRMGRGPFSVTSFKDYRQTLEGKGHVILDACARKDIISKAAKEVCDQAGLVLVEDEGLLAEVAGLAEWPTVLLGDMDAAFLELPAEVIQLSMRTHQKYFSVQDKNGKLAAKFVVVANQVAPDGGVEITKGNARVLSARLDDARFFQAEDVRDGKKLIDNYDKLDGIIFHQKLGTVKDKAERVAALARELAPKVGADPDKAELAAKLAKCDLVTNMVVEFTSLQGKIGRLMYEKEGGDKDIATAIEDHYKPQGPSDRVPTNRVAVAVALADKVDSLFEFWVFAKEKPTGSKDPYALRRAGLGMIKIEVENEVDIWPRWYFEQAAKLNHQDADYLTYAYELDDLQNFLQTRMENLMKSQNRRMDTVQAVWSANGQDSKNLSHYKWYMRARALEQFLATDDGANLLAGYKRAANILKAEEKKPEGVPQDIEPHKGTLPQEGVLFSALVVAAPLIEKALAGEDYAGAMTALAGLRAPIDAFFDDVIVNSDVASERENRLGLLIKIRNLAGTIADFDRVEG
ncbi:MAG: glycine--tRNA ligase subunit beta [Robiginitomaculum sp.]|nr:MAG: glycine--tRNA ligase subunit beta [Robiginitomaculum sp.]